MEETEMLKEEIAKMKEDHEIELCLTRGGVRNLKAAMAIFEKDSLPKNEDGNFADLEGAVSGFKNENPWLFNKPAPTVSTGIVHGRGGGKTSDEMSDEEYYRALRDRKGITK